MTRVVQVVLMASLLLPASSRAAGAVPMVSAPMVSAPMVSAHMVRGESTAVGSRSARVAALRADVLERDKPYDAITKLVPSATTFAFEMDRLYGDQSAGPLDGLLLAVKANIDLSDVPANAGAKFTRTTPSSDAGVVRRVRDAGGIVVAVTNMDTWARGTATISQTDGTTGNAWDPTRSPYGSSGGAAVAVSRGYVDAAIGTDTCGSLRLPAAANAVFGLRPTAGAVTREGVVPLSPTQDVVGPIARDPLVLERVLHVIRGFDPGDPLTWRREGSAPHRFRRRVGLLKGAGAVSAAADAPVTLLRAAGVTVVSVVPHGLVQANVIEDEYGPATDAWRDGRPYLDVDLPVADPAGYRARLAARTRLRAALTKLLDDNDLDALVYPTTTAPPAGRGERQTTANCWMAANSGLPALAVPGAIVRGFPTVGVDLLGRSHDEDTLLALAKLLPVAPRPPGVE